MNFKDKELILFDLDGTLIDSAPDLALAVNHTLDALNRSTFDENIIRSWVGNGAQTLVKRAISGKSEVDLNIDEDLFEDALNIFLNFYKNNLCVKTKTYPNVTSTIRTLQERGYILAIVTNKPFDFIEPILKGLELSDIFELCLGGDSLTNRKPHHEPLCYACEKLNISINKSIMIGDSKNDILAAKAAKMDSIGVSYGYNYGEDIEIYKPDVVVDNFGAILKRFI
ncbi:MAG: phosphoglycolate phosphatase [Campylobacterota bacterium]|nr:phosphoglycolate phosphatase [Campylobacterota bacterium]